MADYNGNNPRNAQSSLFKRLTRLFSGPIVTRRSRQIQSQRSKSVDKYTFRTNTGREFKKKEWVLGLFLLYENIENFLV